MKDVFLELRGEFSKKRWRWNRFRNASPKSCYRLNDCRIEGRNKKQPMLWLHRCPVCGWAKCHDFLGCVWYVGRRKYKKGWRGSKMRDFPQEGSSKMFVVVLHIYESKSCFFVFNLAFWGSHIQFRRNLPTTKRKAKNISTRFVLGVFLGLVVLESNECKFPVTERDESM